MKAKVLWFDARDGYGIIKDLNNNEYYVDTSTIVNRQSLKHGQTVEFEVNKAITDCLCAIVSCVGCES